MLPLVSSFPISFRKVKNGGSTFRLHSRLKNWCEPCEWGFPSAKELERHQKGPQHAKKFRVLAELKAFAEQAA